MEQEFAIAKIYQYYQANEFELVRQLCVANNISLKEIAGYILEKKIPRKLNIESMEFDYCEIEINKDCFDIHIRNQVFLSILTLEPRKIPELYFGYAWFRKGWLEKILFEFTFTIKGRSSTFPKRFEQRYITAWHRCRDRIAEALKIM